ncbi:hypothetical protein AYM40_13155 [Paraburkholderia phytofirmans OLGA172]|uniref:Uncharacterized protein n=1 Tax=Paraburkholderia phytofirmans OLGA172 TaxID=1417228 RepID=A0A161I6S5_9BURK|nr:hypothetical protein AYM40_13155 [Paraburkholderia phytofirmans OLGA172]
MWPSVAACGATFDGTLVDTQRIVSDWRAGRRARKTEPGGPLALPQTAKLSSALGAHIDSAAGAGRIRDNFRQTLPCSGRMASLRGRSISIPRFTVNNI